MAAAPTPDLDRHVQTSMNVVTGAVAIAMAFGIGLYILFQLNNATGGQIQTAYDLLSSQNTLLNTVVTFLFIGVVALVGIGLVKYLQGIRTGG